MSIFYPFSSILSLSHVRPFATPWTALRQASLSITNSWSLLKLMSIKLVMPSNHLIFCHSLLLLPSIFPSIRVLFFFFSGVQFITPAGPRQSLLLAKDPDQHLWKSFIPHVKVSKTHQPKSLEAYKGRVNTVTITPSFTCYVFKQLIINKPTVIFQPVNNR